MSRVRRQIMIRIGPEAVLDTVRDLEIFPKPLGILESVGLLSRSEDKNIVTTEWVASLPKLRRALHWTQEETWNPMSNSCSFRQVSGDFDEFFGSWNFTKVEQGMTRFDLVADYRLEIPLIGAMFRSAIQQSMESIMESFQQAIKNHCEGRG